MKKKIIVAMLATTMALTGFSVVTTSASEINASSVSASQYSVTTPKFTSIENADGQVNLSWKSVSGAYKYRVYYKGRRGWTRFAETTGTTAVDKIVKSGETYTYTVRALGKNNNFVSDFDHNGWRHTYVSVPKFTNIENTDGQVNLSWKSVSGAYKYRVYYKGRKGWTRFAETTGTTAVDKIVKSGETYTYTVRALDKNNNFVSDFDHNGWRHTYVDVPILNAIENVNGGVKLNWKSVDGAYKYRVYYKGRNGWTKFAETTDTTAVDKIVKSGETYIYTVRALDENDNFVSDFNHSGWQHTYIATLATPQITQLENTKEGIIKITWDKVDGAEYYRVFRRDTDGWERVGTTSDTSITDANVEFGNTYIYTVRCVDGNDNYVSDYVSSGWQITCLEWHEAVYEYIEHPAKTETVYIIDQEEYSYEEPVYEMVGRTICNKCGEDITDNSTEHLKNHVLNEGYSNGYHVELVKTQTGTQIITVPEQGHYETIIITEAWTEEVLVRKEGFY